MSVLGLFTRTKPGAGVSGITTGFYALAKDPSVAGRIWGNGLDFSTLGFTTDGTNYTAKTLHPGSGAMHQLLFTASHAWLVTGPNLDRQGQVWRSPLPDEDGNGLAWTLMFDLAAPPAGIATGVNSFFRPQCLAVAGANVYLLEYGSTVTGGPSLYYSANTGTTWTKVKTWANAKHGHALHVVGGVPLVMLGDSGASFTDIGLWRATTAAATAWSRISQYGESSGGNTLYGINFQPVTVNGKSMLAIEYDGALNLGPLLFPDSGATAQVWPLLATFELPPAYYGTMRCLTLTSEGNLMWVQTAENGTFGPNDTVWISEPPFTDPVLLDTFATSTMFLGDPIEDGDYVWFGHYRCHKEQFASEPEPAPTSPWASVPEARVHWKSGVSVTDDTLADLLAAATEQCADYAPALAPGDPIPFRYKLAVIYQARELYNAGQRDNQDAIGVGDFIIRARPLSGTIKQLLRPQRVAWTVG